MMVMVVVVGFGVLVGVVTESSSDCRAGGVAEHRVGEWWWCPKLTACNWIMPMQFPFRMERQRDPAPRSHVDADTCENGMK